MNHMASESSLLRPTFSTAAHDILTGRLPLFGTLSDREKEAGKTDCAIVALDWSVPGCLVIAVLRKRKMHVVGSFQTDTPIFWGEDVALVSASDLEASPLHSLLDRFATALQTGDLGSIALLDDPKVARTFVEAFSQHEQAA